MKKGKKKFSPLWAEQKQSRFRRWKSGKVWLYAGTALMLFAGTGGLVYQATQSPSVSALTLSQGDTLLGNINGSIPVIKSSTTDMTSAAFQKTVDSLLEDLPNQPQYVVDNLQWGANTKLAAASSGNIVPLSSWQGNSGNGPYSIFAPNGTNTSLYADGFSPSDLSVNLPIDGSGWVQIMNVGTAKDLSTGQSIPLDMQVTINGVNLLSPANNMGVIFSAHNMGSTVSLGVTPVQTGGTSSGGSNEGGTVGGNGGPVEGLNLGWMDHIDYSITLRNHDTGAALPDSTLIAMKVSDIDGYQNAQTSTQGWIGTIVAPNTGLTINGSGLSFNGANTTINDGKTLLPNAYIALKQINTNTVALTDQSGMGDPNEGTHFDIVVDLFGQMGYQLNVNGYLQLDKTVAQYGKEGWNSHYSFDKLQFQAIDKDGKVVKTIALDANGMGAKTDLPPGIYTLHEISSDWSATGQTQRPDVTVTIKAGQTTTLSGKDLENQAVVGQNTLEKSDKDTSLDQDGKAVLKDAKYAYFYNDDSTGSSPHKKGDPIKWTDNPAPTLLTGEKVTSAVIGGTTVNFGDQVVIDVSDDHLQSAIGNLPAGDYKVKEVDAGEGYVVDPVEHEFSITQSDEKTTNIISPNVKSQEQVIKAKVTLDKMVTLPEAQGGSGYNGIEFTASPLEGTVADPVSFKTGVNPNTGDDGYASGLLVYGDWKIEETKGVEGYENVKPVYIHMTTDTTKDILTITASYHEDFSQPFSSRTFNLSDDAPSSNPNGEDTVGTVSSDTPTISLSTLHFNDNPTPAPTPSIDIEKSNATVPNAGEGNDQDQANNAGENDHDTPETALMVEPGVTTVMAGRISNNGTEPLTKTKFEDRLLNGTVSVKDLSWTYKGQALTTDNDGYFLLDGKMLVLQPDETLVEETGKLAALPEDELHGDEFGVSAVGVTSGETVGDHDKWYGKTPKPVIDLEKANDKMPESGKGNNQDKPNNVANDHDTSTTALQVHPDQTTLILFKGTNLGSEPLDHLKFTDKTTNGKIDVTGINFTYKGQKLTMDNDGYFLLDGKLLILQPGESIEAQGKLGALPLGQLHGDHATLTGTGIYSKKTVSDSDDWYGENLTPVQKVVKGVVNIYLPKTGDAKSILTALGAWLSTFAVIVGLVVLNEHKRHTLAMAYHKMLRKIGR